ncbi:universal stress protein [Halorubellus salinus]|uniref:universal stress protein n=1 Tax=Halorubellus salinus TaxID=755309 RepID=UPI001D060576|nr:universal stress protein [Halorubellus salinus]
MTAGSGVDDMDLLARVLLPVANEADARATAIALEPYDPAHVTAVHVVEKGEGVPDKTPVEQSEAVAESAYAAVRTVFPDADDSTAYARDVVAAIIETAEATDATAIAVRPRGGGRLTQLLSGDLTRQLVTDAPLPVIVLPSTEDPT